MTTWDYLIVTASNERQAEAYRSQLELRRRLGRIPQAKTVLAIADPGGVRVGSGGSTIFCLMRVLERELAGEGLRAAGPRAWRETLDRLRILIIHAGGDSKRLPAYGPCGKIFVPVPAPCGLEPVAGRPGGWKDSGGSAPGPIRDVPTTIFDRLAPIYLGLRAPASGRGQTVISTGDVLLFFDPRRAEFKRGGITALGCLAPPEISLNHGVFIPDREGTIRRYLQKPSIAAQEESGAIIKGRAFAAEVKRRACGSSLARGLYPRASKAEIEPRAEPGVSVNPVIADDSVVSDAAAGARGRSILDIGVMSFDAETAVRLLKMCGVGPAGDGANARGGSGADADARHRLSWSGPTAAAVETKGLDIFREIACALGVDTKFGDYAEAALAAGSPWPDAALRRIYAALAGTEFSLSLLPRCRFLHFGTSRELIRSGNALRRRDRTAAPGDSVVSLNNVFVKGRAFAAEVDPRTKPRAPAGAGVRVEAPAPAAVGQGRITGAGSWVEGCRIGARLEVPGGNVVVGLDIAAPLTLPRRAAIDVLKGRDRRGRTVWFVRAYGVDDIFNKSGALDVRDVCDVCDDQVVLDDRVVRDNRVDQVGRLAGLPLGEWLKAVGATPGEIWPPDVAPADRQVWNGRFFPAVGRAAGYRTWLWMLEPGKATEAQKRQWRRADRYSFAEMAVLADQEAFHGGRGPGPARGSFSGVLARG